MFEFKMYLGIKISSTLILRVEPGYDIDSVGKAVDTKVLNWQFGPCFILLICGEAPTTCEAQLRQKIVIDAMNKIQYVKPS